MNGSGALLVMSVLFAAHAPAPSGTEDAGLRLVVTTDKPAYVKGEAIRIRLVWTNTGATELRIPYWNGPQMGATAARYGGGKPTLLALTILHDGRDPVPYEGPMAGRFYQEGLHLTPGQSRDVEHRIDDTYNLSRLGRYVIRVAYAGFNNDYTPAHGWKGLIVHPDVEFVVSDSNAP
jgi:hypothetical protein